MHNGRLANLSSLEFFLLPHREQLNEIARRTTTFEANRLSDAHLHRVLTYLQSCVLRAAVLRNNALTDSGIQQRISDFPGTPAPQLPNVDNTGVVKSLDDQAVGVQYLFSGLLQDEEHVDHSEDFRVFLQDGSPVATYTSTKNEKGSTKNLSLEVTDIRVAFDDPMGTDLDEISRSGPREFFQRIGGLRKAYLSTVKEAQENAGLIRYASWLERMPSLMSIYETERFAAIALLIAETARDQGIDLILTNITNREKASGSTHPYIPPFNGALTADFSIAGQEIRLTLYMPGSYLSQFQIAPAPVDPSKIDDDAIDWTNPLLGLQSKISLGVDQGLRFFETQESGNPYDEAYEVIAHTLDLINRVAGLQSSQQAGPQGPSLPPIR